VAVELARRGCQVLIVGRDADRGAAVLAELDDTAPGKGHALVRADLALMTDTARAAEKVGDLTGRLDSVVLCAGVLAAAAEWTDEDLERSLALNYLSRYLLLRRLLPLLAEAPSGRVVLVANAGRYRDTLDLDDPHLRRGKQRGLRVAGRTQFANDLLAVELADRVRGTGIEVTCVFPGVVATDVFRNARGLPRTVQAVGVVAQRLIAASPAAAARTPVYLADDPDAVNVGGAFYGPRLRRLRVPTRASRPDRRAALWAASEDIVRPWLPLEDGFPDRSAATAGSAAASPPTLAARPQAS